MQVLRSQCRGVVAVEWELARRQFVVDERQAVLVALAAWLAVEHLGSRVLRRHATGNGRCQVVQVLEQSEVGHLHMPADKQDILGLDIEVLERTDLLEVVERFGGFAEVFDQLVARDSRLPGLPADRELLLEAHVGHFRHDHQLPVDDFNPFEVEQERMVERFHQFERPEFPRRPFVLDAAMDELDGLDQAAGGDGLPDFAVAAGADALAEHVARNRLGALGRLECNRGGGHLFSKSAPGAPVCRSAAPARASGVGRRGRFHGLAASGPKYACATRSIVSAVTSKGTRLYRQ